MFAKVWGLWVCFQQLCVCFDNFVCVFGFTSNFELHFCILKVSILHLKGFIEGFLHLEGLDSPSRRFHWGFYAYWFDRKFDKRKSAVRMMDDDDDVEVDSKAIDFIMCSRTTWFCRWSSLCAFMHLGNVHFDIQHTFSLILQDVSAYAHVFVCAQGHQWRFTTLCKIY